MGLFSNNRAQISKEYEIDLKIDGEALLAIIKNAGIKAQLKGNTIKVYNLLLSRIKADGVLMDTGDNEWTGSIILRGDSEFVLQAFAKLTAGFKKYTK